MVSSDLLSCLRAFSLRGWRCFQGYQGPAHAGSRWSSRGTTCVSCLPTGSLCGDGTSSCYLLPVFDTVFVRRQHRRRGLGLAMLRDFCQTFRDDEALGISWPISPAMYQGDGCVGEEHLGSGTRISRVFQVLLGREIPRSPGTMTGLCVFSSF